MPQNNSLGLFLCNFSQLFANGRLGIATAHQEFIEGSGFEKIDPFDVHISVNQGFKFEIGLSIPELSSEQVDTRIICYNTALIMEVFEFWLSRGLFQIFTAPIWGLADDFFRVAEEMKKIPIYSLGILDPISKKAKVLGNKTRNLRFLSNTAREELQNLDIKHDLPPHQVFVIWKLAAFGENKEQTWVRLKDSEVDRLLTIK